MNKKNALIIVPRLPFPLNSGGRIAIYHSLLSLAKTYKITLVIIDDNKKNINKLDEFNSISNNVYFFGKNKINCICNALLGLFFGRPLQVGYFYFKDVQKLVNKLYFKNDFVLCFMIRTSNYAINLNIKKYNYAIDSMYINYKNSLKNSTSLFWKLIYKIELPLLYNFELNQIKKFNLTTFVNHNETLFWRQHGIVKTLSHGIERKILNYNNYNHKYKNIITFIGRMDYQPNIDAVLWFCEKILPFINSEITFYIIGGYPTKEILNFETKFENVKVLGFVDDPYSILQSCICNISPMQTGGGLQTKILTAMAVECIVISTTHSSIAIEGLTNNINIIIEDNPLSIANIINDIYSNSSKYQYIKYNARNFIINNYSQEISEQKINHLIEKYLL